MAEPVEVAHWSGEGVRLSQVAGALMDLRAQSSPHVSARTAVMTLVAIAPTDDQAYDATGALRSVAGHHPSRIILVRPDADSVARLSARTTLYALAADHHPVNFEEIRLEVGGQAALHLDSIVEPFTLSDLPVVVWYVGSIPEPSDPLIKMADAVLVDSRDAPEPAQLRSVLALARRRCVVDLSWNRLRPWRELLAGLFDPPSNRHWLDELEEVSVKGKAGPRRLLAGWLAERTGVSHRRIRMADARHAGIQLTAGGAGNRATFSVERVEGQRLVVAEAVVPGSPPLRSTDRLPDDPLASSLAGALTHVRPDPIWERALSAATALE